MSISGTFRSRLSTTPTTGKANRGFLRHSQKIGAMNLFILISSQAVVDSRLDSNRQFHLPLPLTFTAILDLFAKITPAGTILGDIRRVSRSSAASDWM